MKVFMAATFTNFGLRLIFAHVLSATAMGPAGIWWSIPIGWALADLTGFLIYLKYRDRLMPSAAREAGIAGQPRAER